MAYYTDYETIVAPVEASGGKTNAAVSNVIANYMVLYAGCTLIRSATEGVESSSTNYAEVLYNDMYMRISQSSTTYGGMSIIFSKTSNGPQLSSSTANLYYESNTTKAVTVRLRFYNTKTGFYIEYLGTNSAYSTFVYSVACERISTGVTAHCVGTYPALSTTVYINDGLGTAYTLPSSACAGAYDVDGVRQVLTQLALVPALASVARYLMQTAYGAKAYLLTGVVQIGARVFYIPFSEGVAFELNP